DGREAGRGKEVSLGGGGSVKKKRKEVAGGREGAEELLGGAGKSGQPRGCEGLVVTREGPIGTRQSVDEPESRRSEPVCHRPAGGEQSASRARTVLLNRRRASAGANVSRVAGLLAVSLQ